MNWKKSLENLERQADSSLTFHIFIDLSAPSTDLLNPNILVIWIKIF